MHKMQWSQQVILFVLCFMFCSLQLGGTTLLVPSQYPTIQAGLNAAQAGDTVLVAPGTYVENIAWPSFDGIVLISEDGADTTAIDGDGGDRVIGFPNISFSNNTQIIGFTIQNGYAVQGAGIYISQGSPYIHENIIQRNIATGSSTWVYGGGIFCDGTGTPLIANNTIRGNAAKGEYWNYGGGIYIDNQNSATIWANIIENDSTIGGYWNYGSGIYCDGGSSPDIRHNIIQNNVAFQGDRGHGAGIYVDNDCNAYILSNLIYNNTAQSGSWNYGGGMLINSGAEVLNNTIVGNSCFGGNWNYGGGIRIYDSTNTIGNNIIVNNSASAGGGIYAASGDHATLLNNDVWNNTGGNYSGISPGPDDISVDPLFVAGPLGNYYLSQISAGQGQDSPCIDYGFATAESLELDTYTTRTDTVPDSAIVDIGYHYPTTVVVSVEENKPVSQNSTFQVTPSISHSQYKIFLTINAHKYLKLEVFDRSGRLQRTIFNGMLCPGEHELIWNGYNTTGNLASSGIYFITVEIGNSERLSKKVILIQ